MRGTVGGKPRYLLQNAVGFPIHAKNCMYVEIGNQGDRIIMSHIVVLGGGIGGISAAYELRANLDRAHKVTVVSKSPFFQFTPSNPWVAVKWRTKDADHDRPRFRAAAPQGGFRPRRGREGGARGEPRRAVERRIDRLRLSGHRHRAGTRLRRDRGLRTREEHQFDLRRRSRRQELRLPGRRSAPIPARSSSAPCRAHPASVRPTSSP